MKISACVITWNEEEMLPGLLAYLDSVKGVDEICILDSASTDRTQELLGSFRPSDDKVFRWDSCNFEGFGSQRQRNHDMASGDWIWWLDADETFSNIEDLLFSLDGFPQINMVQFPFMILYPDRRHILVNADGSLYGTGMMPVPKMVRKGFARFTTDRKCHEALIDRNGRLLYGFREQDILWTAISPAFERIFIKHAQLLKGQKVLLEKGLRWEETGMAEESARHGVPVYSTWWAEADSRIQREIEAGKLVVRELERQYYDVTTEMP